MARSRKRAAPEQQQPSPRDAATDGVHEDAVPEVLPAEQPTVHHLPTREATPTPPAAACTDLMGKFPLGCKVRHILLDELAIVVRHAVVGDFLHRDQLCIQHSTTHKKRKVLTTRWCYSRELELCNRPSNVVESPQDEPICTPTVNSNSTRRRPFQVDQASLEAEVAEVVRDVHVELASHERVRSVPEKAQTKGGTEWALFGKHRTSQTKVSLTERLESFPHDSLCISPTPLGEVLFCQSCRKEIQNIMQTIKTHVSSERHKENVKKWHRRGNNDSRIKEFLHEYFNANPRQRDSSVNLDVQVFRWRTVEAFMYAGIPLGKIDSIRSVLERGGCCSLTSSTHLRDFVPMIEQLEIQRLRSEVSGQQVCMIYDGTTRLGECTAVL